MASRREIGGAVAPFATTSFVSMLPESSHSTAIVGISSGRNSSVHSGWFKTMTAKNTSRNRTSSKYAIERAYPLRRQAIIPNAAVEAKAMTDNASDQ